MNPNYRNQVSGCYHTTSYGGVLFTTVLYEAVAGVTASFDFLGDYRQVSIGVHGHSYRGRPNGKAGTQGLIAKTELVRNPIWRIAARFGALYTVAASCVLIWRGTWLGWDLVYEHAHHCPVQQTGPKATDTKHALYSGAASHVSAIIALLGCGMFCSVLAPPAAACILRDASVKSASRYYTGPAQQVVNRLWGGPLATSREYYSQTTHRSKRHISPLNDRILAHARSSTTTLRNNNTNRRMVIVTESKKMYRFTIVKLSATQ
jgi:hypothetical protein